MSTLKRKLAAILSADEKAHRQANEAVKIDPNFSIDNFADRIPYKNQSDTDRILNALRKAGLK